MNTDTPRTILVVDDTADNIVLLDRVLKRSYRVKVATSGAKALAVAEASPDLSLILLDIVMPGMDGYEVCRQLKANPVTRDIPVVFLTAMTDDEDERKGIELGAVDYITKPISVPILKARVDNHVRLKEAQDQLRDQNTALEAKVRARTLELQQLNAAMSRFVPGEFLGHIEREGILDVQLGDQAQRVMTVLFCDIRDFASLCERLSPAETFAFLNAYLGQISPIIREYEGFIDKYVGDGIMALFSAPPDRVLDCCVAMMRRLREWNEAGGHGLAAPVRIGIGLNRGELMLGTVGEAIRMDTTVIGDAVNVASRLEQLTKQYGVSIVLSGDVFDAVGEPERFHLRFLDRVRVKGKHEPTALYELYDADPPERFARKRDTAALFALGQRHYAERRFGEAIKVFTDVLGRMPDDLATKHYLERSARYLLEGVPDDWEGIRDWGT